MGEDYIGVERNGKYMELDLYLIELFQKGTKITVDKNKIDIKELEDYQD